MPPTTLTLNHNFHSGNEENFEKDVPVLILIGGSSSSGGHLQDAIREFSDVSETFVLKMSKDMLKQILVSADYSPEAEECRKVLSELLPGESAQPVSIAHSPSNLLTQQEKEILRRLAQGLRNQQIAEELFISPHTVRTHRNNIHRKLEICGAGINPVALYAQYASALCL